MPAGFWNLEWVKGYRSGPGDETSQDDRNNRKDDKRAVQKLR
jgi:hypothetical protein